MKTSGACQRNVERAARWLPPQRADSARRGPRLAREIGVAGLSRALQVQLIRSTRTCVVVGLALALSGAAAIVASTLGPAGFALAMLGMCCGLAYDIRLKRTVFSAVPFMIAIPTLPSWVWVMAVVVLVVAVAAPVLRWLAD